MSKTRSTWSVLLAVVLAMVVMAGMAITSFAETDVNEASSGTLVTDREELVDVLNGDKDPDPSVNYDVDGNGIVEMADLDAFDGTQEDLLPNGGKDAFSECNPESVSAKTSSAIVRGDSTMSIALDSSVDGYAWLEWVRYDDETGEPIPSSLLDVSGWKELTFDTLWTNGAGALYITIYNDLWETYSITVEATEAGWTTNVIDLLDIPEEFKTIIAMEFTWDGEHEVYIDNLQTAIALQYVDVSFSTTYGSAAGFQVIAGTPYGELPELVHTFYTFEGWYLDQSYTQKVTADTIVEADADHTLYAKWSWIAGEDGKITVTDNGNNSFTLRMDYANYKQFRFNFTLASGSFSMDYTDGDDVTHNDPIVAIVDMDGNTVRPDQVQPGVEYTAVFHGGSVITTAGIITAGEISDGGTLTFAAGSELKITNLEAIGGQLGFTMVPPRPADWTKVDLSKHGYSYGYEFHQTSTVSTASGKWETRIGLSVPGSRYTQMSFDFYLFDIQGTGAVWFTPSMPVTIYDANGNEVAGTTKDNTQLAANTWYTAVFTLPSKSGSQYIYFFDDANDVRNTFKMYVANVFFKGDGDMIDNLAPSVTVNKSGADGTFVTTPITRDTDRGTYYVAGSSANWNDRALKVTMNDATKDLVQMDIRFLTSKDASGKDVAPTIGVSTTVSGAYKAASYVILDENDVPVTEMEIGKWYRLFITTAGGSTFAVVPATTGEVKMQVKNLDAFQADELATTMLTNDISKGTMSVILTKFGKLEYAYAGSDNNTVAIRLNSNLYKQVRFSFQLKNRATIVSLTGANMAVKDAGGNAVSVTNLQTGVWYSAIVTNSGDALPQSLTLNVAGKTTLLIKDLNGYVTTEEPTSPTMSDKYHGLEADEMMIAGFVGPRDEEYVVSYRYDQKTGNLPSMARDDIFKLLSEAGFNYITDHGLNYAGSGVESVSKLLRLASKYGMNYFVHATDIAEIGTVTATDTSSGNTVNTYYSHLADWDVFKAKLDVMSQYEGFGGLYLRDEPSADLFEVIRDARIRVTDWYNGENGTNLNVFSNLLPGVGSHRWTNGKGTITVGNKSYTISDWQDYISAYEDIVDPDYMMVDMYPFAGDAGIIEGTFIEYISRMAKTAQDQGKDWMGCVQVGGGTLAYGAKRVANEYETNWDVNAMLAFGVRGLTYYTLVSAPYFGGTVTEDNPSYNDHSLLNIKGEKTVFYDYAKAVNTQVQAVDHILMNGSQIGVIFVGDQLTYTGGTGNNNAPYNYADKCRDTEHIPMITPDGTYSYKNTLGITKTGTGAKKYADVKLSNVTGDHVMIGAFSYDDTIALYVVNNDIIARNGNDTSDTIQLSFTGSYAYEIIQDGLTSWQTGTAVSLNLELGHAAMIVLRDAGSVNMDASVFFNLNYETTAPAPATLTIPQGGTYPELPVLKRDFYTFEGWYLNAEGTGEPVEAGDALAVSGSHILYAKWTYHEDTNPLQFNTSVEKDHVSITRQYIDGVETYVYTTEGKTLVNAGWQRRIGFIVADTTKEVVKFRMKVVSSELEDGTVVNPDFYFYSGSTDAEHSGHMVLVDENDKVIQKAEIGKWYTVYALVQGNTDLSMFVGNSCAENLVITIQIQDRELLDYEPEVGIQSPSISWYGETTPYQDSQGNWLVHHRSFTGEHHSNTAWNRRMSLKNPNGFETVSFEFKYNVSQYAEAGAELADNVTFAGLSMTYFDMNGMPVAASNLKVGQWYRAVVGGTPAASTDWYAMGYANGQDGKTVNVDMDFRNIKGIPADTNEVVVGVRDTTNLSKAVDYVNGKHIYTTTTRGVSNPGTGAWQWGTQITVPMEAEYFAVTFRIMEAYAADGVTALRPSMSAWQTDLSSGTSAWIVETETGKIISTDNGSYADSHSNTHTLELGKWYTIISNTPHATSGRYFLFPCQQYSGKALITMEISDRSYIVPQDITVDTPDSYGWPYPIYSVEDDWHYTVFENNSTYNAWQRRTDFSGVAGAKYVEFEVRINSVSGGCTYRLGTTDSLRKFYDLETGEYLGDNNDVVLEAGKWYKVVATNGNEGALMGNSFRVYPGDATNEGNVSVSFRNFYAEYPETIEVSFDLNYTGAVNSYDPITVTPGAAYGELPAPTRNGYDFGGWYTNAACTGDAVTASTTAGTAKTLYAKWTMVEDTSLLVPSYTTEAYFNSVSRDFVDGKDTIIYTTNGKPAPTEGDYQKRLQFNVGDTTKELVKFRFQFVTFNDANGSAATPKLDFYTGGVGSSDRGNFVIVDEDHNAVSATALQTGKWYTFYGVTRGFDNVSLWPTYSYGKANMDVTLYVQDRELVDFEPEINIRQENTAWCGNTAPYEDKDGNWLFHYRSFTSEHHDNNGWNRRTYIDVPEAYTHVSFEFRFNVSRQGDSADTLADRIEKFYGMDAYYTDLEGNLLNVSDLEVGNWYRVTFAKLSYFIAMSDIGGTVNIDMDIRNVKGYTFTTDYSFTNSYYTTATYGAIDGKFAYRTDTRVSSDPTNEVDRRIYLNIANNSGDVISVKFKTTWCTGTPAMAVANEGSTLMDYVVTDLAGNIVDSTNLELNQWYMVSWMADGSASYQLRPFTGGTINQNGVMKGARGTMYITDAAVTAVSNPFRVPSGSEIMNAPYDVPASNVGYYGKVTPVMLGDEVAYKHFIKTTSDGTSDSSRRTVLSVSVEQKSLVSMEVYFANVSNGATPSIDVRRNDYPNSAVDYILMDADGNVCDGTSLETGKWYTLMWFVQDYAHYQIRPITGSAANGTYYIKNLITKTTEEPFANTYYSWITDVSHATEADDTLYWGITRPNDSTGIGYRRVTMNVDSYAGDIISFKVKLFKVNANGTPNLVIKNAAGTVMNATITDEGENTVNSTDMQLGQWYTVTWECDGSATYAIHAFDGTAVTGYYLLKNVNVVNVNAKFISFNLNYAGATGAPATIKVAGDSAYGALPVPTRVGYDFGGWYTEAACTNEVTEDMVPTDSHTLYAKWTIHEDTSLLQPSYTTETYFTSVSRDFIDGKDTIIYTTNGKPAPNEGDYQRRMTFNVGDTTKEIVKFRFKYVANNNAEGTEFTPRMTYFVGGLADINSRGFVIVDENGNPAVDSMEVGQWYTFYGLVSGQSTIHVYPAVYGVGYLDITLHIQDRELLDYEPEINIRHESHAWYSSTVPYQDNEGNWLFHHRSFTGEHHANSGWNRRIFIDVPEAYTHVSFEFRFNVSRQGDSADTLADRIEKFYGMDAYYTDLEGNLLNVSDLEVGNWYRVTFAKLSYFIAMSDIGGTVNIDMDIRNVQGYTFTTDYSFTNSYYTTAVHGAVDGKFAYRMDTRVSSDPTNEVDRRIYLKVANTSGQVISAKFMITSCTGTPAMAVANEGSTLMNYIITNAAGDVVDSTNLELNKWYTVSWLADGSASYQLRPFTGGTVESDGVMKGARGTYYLNDVSVNDLANTASATWGTDAGQKAAGIYYGVDNGEAVRVYSTKLYAINSSEWSRRMQLSVANTEGQNISMKVKLVSVTDANGNASTQRKLKLNDASNNEYPAAFIDENGTPVAATELELGKWYTMSWTATGAATYNIWPFTGNIHATIYLKDVTVSDAIENPFMVPEGNNSLTDAFGYYGSVTAVKVGDEVMYMHYMKSTTDPTNSENRRAVLNMAVAEKTLISMDVYFTNSTGTPSFEIRRNDDKTITVDYIVVDTDGNVCDAANLQTHKWYTLMWFAQGNTQHQIRPITGSATNGTYYIKNLTATTVEDPLKADYYAWPAPFAAGDETLYWVHVRAPYDAKINDRFVVLKSAAVSGDIISFKMKATEINNNGTPDLIIKNANGTAMGITVSDAKGNVVAPTAMALNQWYTVSWIADGSATYKIHAFAGVKIDGNYFIKDIKVTIGVENPFRVPTAGELNGNSPTGNAGYYGIVTPVAMVDGVAYKAEYYSRNSGDNTNAWHRRAYLYVTSNSGDEISIRVNTASTTSTPKFNICNVSGAAISAVIKDAEGNVVESTAMQTGSWYTISWTSDGSAGYQIQPFDGSGAYGIYYAKDITVTPAG